MTVPDKSLATLNFGLVPGTEFNPLSLQPVFLFDGLSTPVWKDIGRTVPATADGDVVAAIDDSSGSGNHLIGRMATYSTSGVYRTHGQANGAYSLKGVPSTGYYGPFWSDNPVHIPNDFTTFVVRKYTAAGEFRGLLYGGAAQVRTFINDNFRVQDGVGANHYSTTPVSKGSYVVDMVRLSGATCEWKENGVSFGIDATMDTTARPDGSVYFSETYMGFGENAHVVFMCIIPAAITSDNEAAMLAYLRARFAI